MWHALDTCLESLPRRNTLAILGDFNTSLTRAPDYIGISDFLDTTGHRRIGPVHSDATEFHQILKTHHLTVLNTWRTDTGPTFVSAQHSSRIDFVLTRAKQVDGIAKRACLLDHFPVDQIHTTKHLPILATINHRWNRIRSQGPQNATFV